ncbi:MAG: GNAT family N-acetyltransferase [Pseudomonadota bacterium]|nr:GNAT family N-acetyltransferase [Pseudomonadota bacterium]
MALPASIETRRLRLRPFGEDDGAWVERALGQAEVARMLTSLPHPLPPGSAAAWLARVAADHVKGGRMFAVEAEGGPVGCAALSADGSDDLELGYWIVPDAWGRGFASEAGAALREAAFSSLAVRGLKARHAADNPASGRVLDKLGFLRVGETSRWYEARRAEAPTILYRLERHAWLARAAARTPRIETPRLVLRALRLADAPAIYRLAGDWEVARWTALIPHPYPEGEAERFIARSAAGNLSGTGLALAIAERDRPNALIGGCGWSLDRGGGLEIGYWLGRPYWGRGYMTEVVRALADHAFRTTDVPSVRAGIFPDNLRSARVLEKAGFVESGTDHCATPARECCGVTARLFVLERGPWAARGGAPAHAPAEVGP